MQVRKYLFRIIGMAVIVGMLVPMLSFCAVAEQKKTVVTFPSWWFGEPGNKEYFEALIEAFEKRYPSIDVNGYYEPYPGYWDKVLIAVSAGTPPDIIHAGPLAMGGLVRLDVAEPLDKWIDKTDIKQRFCPLQQQSPFEVEGKTYGLLQMIASYIPCYNKRLYREAGIGKFPDTPEEFLTAMKKLTNAPNQYGFAQMVKPGNYTELYQEVTKWVVGFGSHWSKDGIPTANDPRTIKGVEWFKEIYDSGVIPKGVDMSTFRQMWWMGKVATIIDGTFMWGFAASENPDILKDLDAALTPFPGHYTVGAYQAFVIAKDSKHKEEAWKFLELFASNEWQVKQVEDTLCVSPDKNSVTEEFLAKNPWFKNFAISGEKYTVLRIPPGLDAVASEVSKIIADHVESVLFRNEPAKQAMDKCQEDLENFLAGQK